MFFEEAGLDFETHVVNVGAGEQFFDDFVTISPNSKVPVIRDTEPDDGGREIVIFESGAILLYLAEKTGKLMPINLREKAEVLKWTIWQVANQGPMCGQAAHFQMFAPDSSYARDRYVREVRRLFQVLDRRLAVSEFVGGADYTIADIACYPWTEERPRVCFGLSSLDEFPHVERWSRAVAQRPATIRGFKRLREDDKIETTLVQFATNMFGHDADRAKVSASYAEKTLRQVGMKFNNSSED